MIIPIKTVEEMTEQERREYLEGLIEDYILVDQDGNGVSPEEFLNEVPVEEVLKHRTRRPKAKDRDYFKPSEIARQTGLSRDTIARTFWNDPDVKKQTHAGRNRKTYTVMLISKQAAKKRFPQIEL